MENIENVYYTYAYLDPRKSGEYIYDDIKFNYKPFYIGKGKDKRCKLGLYDKNKSHKVNYIKSILNENLNVIIIKIYENLNNDEATKKEIELIKKIGRNDKNLGPLCNHTDGGDGMLGTKHTNEWKNKLCIPVLQYDLNMNLLNEFSSITEASLKINITPLQISKVCNGKKYYKTAGGFIWKFKDKKIQEHIFNNCTEYKKHSEDTKTKMSKPKKWKTDNGNHPSKGKKFKTKYTNIKQYDLNMNFIKEWKDIYEIYNTLNFFYTNISNSIKNGCKSYKFYWKI